MPLHACACDGVDGLQRLARIDDREQWLLRRPALAMCAGDLQCLARQQDPVVRPVHRVAHGDPGARQIDVFNAQWRVAKSLVTADLHPAAAASIAAEPTAPSARSATQASDAYAAALSMKATCTARRRSSAMAGTKHRDQAVLGQHPAMVPVAVAQAGWSRPCRCAASTASATCRSATSFGSEGSSDSQSRRGGAHHDVRRR